MYTIHLYICLYIAHGPSWVVAIKLHSVIDHRSHRSPRHLKSQRLPKLVIRKYRARQMGKARDGCGLKERLQGLSQEGRCPRTTVRHIFCVSWLAPTVPGSQESYKLQANYGSCFLSAGVFTFSQLLPLSLTFSRLLESQPSERLPFSLLRCSCCLGFTLSFPSFLHPSTLPPFHPLSFLPATHEKQTIPSCNNTHKVTSISGFVSYLNQSLRRSSALPLVFTNPTTSLSLLRFFVSSIFYPQTILINHQLSIINPLNPSTILNFCSAACHCSFLVLFLYILHQHRTIFHPTPRLDFYRCLTEFEQFFQ